jgi:phosphopantetheinyl transferase
VTAEVPSRRHEPSDLIAIPSVAIIFADLSRARTALEAIERRLPRLSRDEEQRFNELSDRDRDAAAIWRAAHIALRLVLERTCGPEQRGVPVGYDPGGRPYLPASSAIPHPPHFSLSHTGQSDRAIAVIAMSHAAEIGVDVELVRAISVSPERRRRIAQAAAILAPSEALSGSHDDQFLQTWVRLEAAAKASGEGIGRLLGRAGIIGSTPASDFAMALRQSDNAPLVVRDLPLPHGCFGAVASSQLPNAVAVEHLPVDEPGLAAFLD